MKFRSLADITSMCRRILGTRCDYESVAAAIWMESWENIGCPSTQAEVQVSWSFVRNRCLDYLRRQKIEAKANEVKLALEESVSTELEVPSELLNLIMERAKLTNQQFYILTMYFWQKKTLTEIAEEGVWTLSIVKNEFYHALQELKRVSRRNEYE